MHIFPQTYRLPAQSSVCKIPRNFIEGCPMLFALVSRGKKSGKRLFPHRFNDNRYHVHLGRKGPYIPVSDHRDPPSLIKPESIQGWSTNPKDLFFPSL